MGTVNDYLAAGTYWVLTILWGFILAFYLHRLWSGRLRSRLVIILIVVLGIDAFRTLVESVYFGTWYTSTVGFLPAEIGAFLTRPDILIYPKLLTVIAAVLIIAILFRYWLPHEEREVAAQQERTDELERRVQARTDALNRAKEQLERELTHQQVLMDELDHRVKNNLASVMSIARLTLAGKPGGEVFERPLMGRLHALARTHEMLAASRWEGADVGSIIEMGLEPYMSDNHATECHGPEVMLDTRAAPVVCMVLHELVTNAVKYGAFATPGGRLEITWRTVGSERFELEWCEMIGSRGVAPFAPDSGGEEMQPAARMGQGLQLIRGLIEHDLHGTVEFKFEQTGLRSRIDFPLTRTMVEGAMPSRPA